MKIDYSFSSCVLVLLFLCAIDYMPQLGAQVSMTEHDWILPTYPVNPPDPNPSFFKNESYQGASRHFYPYPLDDNFTSEKVDKAWKALTLENEYIKLSIMPEMGGKLYYAEDKTNEYNFLYKNDVVKPANIGMTGAWVSGGIEWNVMHHHRASSYMPVDYKLVENDDGSKTIWIGETELRHRMQWAIGITAFPGKSYFEAEIRIHNPTAYTNSFLYWANVATHTNENYQAIFPPSVQFATYHAKNAFTHWPISKEMFRGQDFTEGVDISWWKNSTSPNSYFAHDLKEDFMGGYDHGSRTGTVHIGDHNIVKGAKLWEWGSGPMGQSIEAQLNENAGPYVELMVGAFSDNQPDYSWIKPYEVKTVKQYWYPIKDIDGFKYANLNGAVNLESREDDSVFLGYYSTQLVPKARIVLKYKEEIILEEEVTISPEKAFTQTISVAENFELTDVSTSISNAKTGEVLIEYQPVSHEYIEDLPETVKPPKSPKEIDNLEELFLVGSRIEQFYNPRLDPMEYYEELLSRDNDDIRTNTAVGNIYLKNGNYEKARGHFAKAIKRLTKDYTRPSDCEALFLQGVTLKKLGLYNEAVDTLYRATWDYAQHSASYLELARISAIKGDYTKSLHQVNESLSTNSRNNSAITLKSAVLRKLGKNAQALDLITPMLKNNPLDLRANYELYLLTQMESEAYSRVESILRGYDQNYLEVAIGYMNDGMADDALQLLSSYTELNPIIKYYEAYISELKGEYDLAIEKYMAAAELDVRFVFPFRLETIQVLDAALKQNPNDAHAHYYIGNILFEKQAEVAIEHWQKALDINPKLAIAARNLGWAYRYHYEDLDRAISTYEKAIAINSGEPIYYAELDELYELNNASIQKRMNLFEGNNHIVSRREDAFARQISILTLAGRADEAVEYLSQKTFTFNEGSQEVHNITADAYIMAGLNAMKRKEFNKALMSFNAGQVPKELAMRGENGNKNIQSLYFKAQAYEALGQHEKSKESHLKCIDLHSNNIGFIQYYQGLSLKTLGKENEANEIFGQLVKKGEEELENINTEEVDFFAKFGGADSKNAKLANAYLLIGLGHKGLENKKMSKQNLKQSVELYGNNVYGNLELDN